MPQVVPQALKIVHTPRQPLTRPHGKPHDTGITSCAEALPEVAVTVTLPVIAEVVSVTTPRPLFVTAEGVIAAFGEAVKLMTVPLSTTLPTLSFAVAISVAA